MRSSRVALILFVILAVHAAAQRSAEPPNFAGSWTLNRSLSQISEDVGFGMDLLGPGTEATGPGEGAGTNRAALFRESADDAARREHMVNEVRHPPEELRITQTAEAVIIAADRGQPRTFDVDGRDVTQKVGLVTVTSSSRWNGPRFDVRYKVEQNREVHYEYSRTENPARLTVVIRFVERGGHDQVTLVYEPAREGMAATPARGAAPPAAPPVAGAPSLPGGLGQAGRGGLAQPPVRPALPTMPPSPTAPATTTSPQQAEPAPGPAGPDAPLAGIARLGMVVEDLRPQAASCGLTQAPLEAIVSKAFSDAGIKVVKDSDEDTYVYVDIGTSLSAGICVSRYDVYLFTNTMARLSYQSSPVLVQVQLLHQGGLSGGGPAAHGEAVRKNVKAAADEFAARIKAVSK